MGPASVRLWLLRLSTSTVPLKVSAWLLPAGVQPTLLASATEPPLLLSTNVVNASPPVRDRVWADAPVKVTVRPFEVNVPVSLQLPPTDRLPAAAFMST